MRYQKKYGFELSPIKGHETWNVEADAFKHAYGSVLMALEKDELFSFLAGLQHENATPNNPVNENKMDTHNNKLGIKIAQEIKQKYGNNWDKLSKQQQEDIIADKVWKRMQAGDVILSPDGRRKLKGVNQGRNKEENKKTGSGSASKISCVGSYPVSGYTRADGVEVKGYTRTCGAKHYDSNKPNTTNGDAMSESERQSIFDKYKGKKAQDLTKNEIDEFLSAYFG